MKKLLIPVFALIVAFSGCKTVPSDTQITLGAALAARISFSVIPTSHRQSIANYEWYIGNVIYALTNAPTPQGLTELIVGAIPAADLAKFPELQTLIIPAIVDVYTSYYNQYAGNYTKLLQIIKDIAAGVQSIAAQYK